MDGETCGYAKKKKSSGAEQKCERLSPAPVKDELECREDVNAGRRLCLPADGFSRLPVDPPGRLLGDNKTRNQAFSATRRTSTQEEQNELQTFMLVFTEDSAVKMVTERS